MIRLEQVSKHYGPAQNRIPAIDEVSLQIAKAEFVMVTGPSGSGKTTLLNLIAGMTRPDRGSIVIAGRDLLAMPDSERSRLRSRSIGFIFQFQAMLPTLSAIDNVRLPLLFAGRPDDPQLAVSILAKVGLADRQNAFASELSAGQQRRVCIARAIIIKPALLICDEPTGDLDHETANLIMALIGKAHHEGATVVMATHNLELCPGADRTLRLKTGRISG